jgi:outer membrane immunogenic protein
MNILKIKSKIKIINFKSQQKSKFMNVSISRKVKQLLTIILVSIALNSQAQYPLEKGKMQINGGLGLSSWGLPLYVGLDYGVHKDISVGADASWRSYSQSYFGGSYSSTIIGIGGNANYHFNSLLSIPKEWDFYAGLSLGYFIWSVPTGYLGSGASGIGIGAQVGGRYYLSKNFGVNLEGGGGNSTSGGKLGITYKF